jgi:hypothetical protein
MQLLSILTYRDLRVSYLSLDTISSSDVHKRFIHSGHTPEAEFFGAFFTKRAKIKGCLQETFYDWMHGWVWFYKTPLNKV